MAHYGDRLVSRHLPPEEWPRLRGTGACAMRPAWAERGVMLVEECGGAIVGCALVFQTPDSEAHVDGCWVHPEWRSGRVALRLWRAILVALRDLGVTQAAAYPTSSRLDRWASRSHTLRVKGLFLKETA